jgi:broad specificity phosphatase PhoE
LASQGITPTRIIHGGLLRQRQTAEGILAGLGDTAAHSPATQLDAGWDEYDAWGITGALSDTDPRASHDSRVFQDELERGCARWASGDHDADYAETHSTFTTRVDQAFTDARAATGSGETTLVVSSAGSIGWTVARLMGGDFDQWMAFTRVTINTGITKIVTGRSGISLVSFNEHTHLAPDVVTYR